MNTDTRRGRIFQALLDLNILYKSKYFDVMHLEHSFYAKQVIPEYIAEIRSTMSRKELFFYRLYCNSHGIFLGNGRRGIHYLRNVEAMKRGTWKWRKDSYAWEFAELYYEIDKNDLVTRPFK